MPTARQSRSSMTPRCSRQSKWRVTFVGESIPVINRAEGTMVGVVTEADLFKLYLSLQHRVADLERT